MKRLLPTICLMLTACPDPTFMQAHFGKAKYARNSLGEQINSRFRDLVRDCQIVPRDTAADEWEGRDFLPRNFALSTPEINAVPITLSWHTTHIFLYPFTKAEADAFSVAAGSAQPSIEATTPGVTTPGATPPSPTTPSPTMPSATTPSGTTPITLTTLAQLDPNHIITERQNAFTGLT